MSLRSHGTLVPNFDGLATGGGGLNTVVNIKDLVAFPFGFPFRQRQRLNFPVPGLHKTKMVAVKRKTQEEEKKEKFNTGRRVWRLLNNSALNLIIYIYNQ